MQTFAARPMPLQEDFEGDTSKGIMESLRSQWDSPSKRKFLLLKSTVSLVGLILLILTTFHNFSPALQVDCIRDLVQESTQFITTYLKENVGVKNGLTILSSFFIDFGLLVLAGWWILYSDTLRQFFLIMAFYMFRLFLQRLFFLKYPDDFIFGYPGIFSPAVPYFPANDFFYSGHVGISVIFFLEFKKEGANRLKYMAIVGVVINFFVLLVTRAHYIIDLAVGILTAHYFFRLSLWVEQKANGPIKNLFNSEDKLDATAEEKIKEDNHL